MKNQALFLKDKSKKLKCHLLQISFGALRVKSHKQDILWIYLRIVLNPKIVTVIAFY